MLPFLLLLLCCIWRASGSSSYVPVTLTGLLTDPVPRVAVIDNPPGQTVAADCSRGVSGPAELHVLAARAAMRAGLITVRLSRDDPVILVLNSYCCAAITWVVEVAPGTTVQQIVVTKPYDVTTAYTGVEIRGLADGVDEPPVVYATQFPYSAFGNHWQDASAGPFLERVAQFVGVPVASYHAMDVALEFAIGPPLTPAAAPTCPACPNANELYSWTAKKCVCADGFSGQSGACVPLVDDSAAIQLTGMRAPGQASNAVRGLLSATGTGLVDSAGWRCRLTGGDGSVVHESDAFFDPASASLGCLIEPGAAPDSPKVPAGTYNLAFAHPGAPSVWLAVPGAQPATVFDGVARCALATDCTTCDKNACVWCAAAGDDTMASGGGAAAAACVPGATGVRASGATWGSCAVYAGGDACPPSTLTVGGPTAWGKIRGAEVHNYQVTVAQGDANLELWLEADPVSNNDRADLYLVGPGDQGAPTAPWEQSTADDANHLSQRATGHLAGGSLVLPGCNLPPGTWTLSVVGRALFTYRVGVRRGCSCAALQGAGSPVPTLSSLSPALGARLVVPRADGAPQNVTVFGSGFTAQSLCRVRTARCQPQTAGDVGRDPPCSSHTSRQTCRGAPLCEWAGLDHVSPADFKSAGEVVCPLPASAQAFARSSPPRPEQPTPETFEVSVSNDLGCGWAEPGLPYAVWMPIDFAAHVACPSQCQRPAVDGRLLPVNGTDVWRFDLGPGSAHAGASAAQIEVTLMTEGGDRSHLQAWLARRSSPTAGLVSSLGQCTAAGADACTPATNSLVSSSGLMVDRCSVSADEWLLTVRNVGGASNSGPLAYSVTVKCGCAASPGGSTQTSAMSPAAGVADGFDLVTVTGSFVPDLATQCFFEVGDGLSVATVASYVDSKTVRCLTPSLGALVAAGSPLSGGPAEASVYVGGVGEGQSACEVSRVPLSFYYSKPLYTSVPEQGTTQGAEPLAFVLDFGEVLGAGQDPVKSFRVTASLQSALARFRVLIREGEMPDVMAVDPPADKGKQSVLVCNGARTSRWFVVLDVSSDTAMTYTIDVVDAQDNECPDYTGTTAGSGNNGGRTTTAGGNGGGSTTTVQGQSLDNGSARHLLSVLAALLVTLYI